MNESVTRFRQSLVLHDRLKLKVSQLELLLGEDCPTAFIELNAKVSALTGNEILERFEQLI